MPSQSRPLALVVLSIISLTGSDLLGAIMLPIEVIGPPPHTESVILELPSGSEANAVAIEAQVHNVSYKDKGRIRINGGQWFTLWNDVPEVKVAEPDRSYGGFGGGFSTVRFTIETPDITLVSGSNLVEFQFYWKHPDHATAGYRVVRLNILNANGDRILPTEAFVDDDPRTWVPPFDNPNDIAAGESIWRYADLAGMSAHCKDCHTDDGRDLKYFNVSNKTIIEQCKKSGFTEHQGKQVASYIRSLPFDPIPQARPWNPPYQPGPGTDNKPVFEWAAGAGLDAVLADDGDMLPYLFGSGSQQEIDDATDIRTDLNLREMPIAVQFPDWIHWIPRTHPMDVWGNTWWETSKGENPAVQNWNNPNQSYQYLRDQFLNNNLANRADLVNQVENQFHRNILWWIGDARSGHPWTDLDGKNIDQAKARGFTAEAAKLNLARWSAVKLWELVHTFDAEDKAINNYPTAEKYQWPTRYFTVFHFAAHFIGDDRGTSAFSWESLPVGTYFSSIWYQLQMVLNSGMHSGAAVRPVDWAYNFYHVNRLGERTGVHEPLRLVQNLIKCYQQRDRSGEPISKEVWSMREVSPWRLYSDFKGDQTTYSKLDTYGHGKQLRLRIVRSLLSQFLMRSREYQPADWPRTSLRDLNADNWYRLESETYLPRAEPDSITHFNLFSTTGAGDAIEADAMYRLIPLLHEIGLEPPLVMDLANWCYEVWPLADWQHRATDSDSDRLHDYWEGIHYGTLAWDGSDDPEQDQVTNLTAYILGIEDATDTNPGLDLHTSGNNIIVSYRRPVYRDNFSFSMQSGNDLLNWQPSLPDGTAVDALDYLYETVSESHSLSGTPPEDSKYFRLIVTDQAGASQ